MRPVAALFVRPDSIYKTMPGVDAWDIARDARRWPGGSPLVAHPPCRAWGSLRAFAKPRPDEKQLAVWAVDQVRRYGGVLEHPNASRLWPELDLPTGRRTDAWGGWTLSVDQLWWGHKAAKRTRLYIVGVAPSEIPPYPLSLNHPTHVVTQSRRDREGPRARRHLPELSKALREHTPPRLATWLVELARRCEVAP